EAAMTDPIPTAAGASAITRAARSGSGRHPRLAWLTAVSAVTLVVLTGCSSGDESAPSMAPAGPDTAAKVGGSAQSGGDRGSAVDETAKDAPDTGGNGGSA